MLTRVAILRASCLKPTTDLRLATSILNKLLTMPKRRVRLLCGMVVIDTTESMRTVLAVASILAVALLGAGPRSRMKYFLEANAGKSDGLDWARDDAEYVDLKRMSELDDRVMDADAPRIDRLSRHPRGTLC